LYLQELNLQPAARLELQRFLRWNQEPAHRFYHYDYYRDNCSTRVRDALGSGARRRPSGRRPTPFPAAPTYRFHTQRLTANDPLIFTGLLLAPGQGVDRPISKWEEMFLPMEMREHLRGVTVPGSRWAPGSPGPVGADPVRIDRRAAAADPPRWLARYLFLGVISAARGAWLGGCGAPEGLGRVAFGLVAGDGSCSRRVGGVVLAGLWSFTGSRDGVRNEKPFSDQSARPGAGAGDSVRDPGAHPGSAARRRCSRSWWPGLSSSAWC
jgi:hypothetical protein